MYILTVSAFFESHGGGVEIVAGATARAIARLGHESGWAAAAFDPPPDEPLVRPIPLAASDPLERWTGLPMPLPDRNARERLEREVAVADAVIVHDALYATSQLAIRYARRHHTPWVLIQHVGEIPYSSPVLRMAMAGANRLVARPLLRSAPRVVFISDVVRQFFAADVDPARQVLLFNGVDHVVFCPADIAKQKELRSQFGFSDDRRTLLFVGRFVDKKGLTVLRALARSRPDLDFILVGNGPLRPAKWGLPNVRVLGRKSRSDLAELYRAADLLLLPSVGEGFPLVIQEAMACGLPVICGEPANRADPDAAKWLRGVAIDLADPNGSAARCAQTIDGLSFSADDRAAMARYALGRYDWRRMADQVIALVCAPAHPAAA